MKAKSDQRKSSIHYFVFLLVLSISFDNQSWPDGVNRLLSNRSSPMRTEKTNALRLRYTTGVRSILEDSKGKVWFGSHNEGVCLLHNGKLQYFTTENGLSDNQVRNIYEDKNGIIWFECGRGLSIYDGKNLRIYKERNYGAKSMRELNDGDLWFKADKVEGYNQFEKYPGAYQYDGKNLHYRQFPVKPEPGEGFKYYISTPFVEGKGRTVWLGAYGALIQYNGLNFKIFDNQYLGLNSETGLLHIRSIFHDKKGNLWIGNNGMGVLKYDGENFINFTAEQKLKRGDTKGNSLEKVFSIAQDTLGNIWFGTLGSGVWRYDGNSVKNFSINNGVESQHVWTIYKTRQGNLVWWSKSQWCI